MREERRRDAVMVNGGRDDGDGIDAIEERFEAIEGGGAEPGGDFPRLGRVGIDDADQFHVRQSGEDARVVLAQVPDSNHRHSHSRHSI